MPRMLELLAGTQLYACLYILELMTELVLYKSAVPLIFKGFIKYICVSGLNFEINFTHTWKEELVKQTGRK